jgi:hypothetical protein
MVGEKIPQRQANEARNKKKRRRMSDVLSNARTQPQFLATIRILSLASMRTRSVLTGDYDTCAHLSQARKKLKHLSDVYVFTDFLRSIRIRYNTAVLDAEGSKLSTCQDSSSDNANES